METKEEIMLPSPSKGLANNGEQCSPGDDSGSFYMKLAVLLESSGLSLIFNVRETLLDLYLFYLEVTRREGYHQVDREKKWGEVVFALKLEGNSVKLCAQAEKFYAHLLYQFEQLYFYRRPAKQAGSNSTKGPLQKKRKSTASLPHTMDIKDGHKKTTEMSKDYSCNMTAVVFRGAYTMLWIPTKQVLGMWFYRHPHMSKKPRNTEALEGQKILRLAIDAWRNMSTIEKKPYEEESKKNKEAMIGNKKEEKWHSLSGDNLVTSQPETDDSKLVKKATEKSPTDPSFIFIYN
ncbi:hypothetical protein AAZX31_08G052700 [Glycine max]|nr:hypothetical protein JHK85_020982 [Glycine max]KAG5024627.1 hypothetical protein JHK86_020541 [Glycine max]KAG5135798.1 hypothetical protein JHK82_020529 [Glycine max]